MINYETLMLVRTEITGDELRALERHFDKLIGDRKGNVILFDRWGKYKLAYPIKKNVYGIYILVRYEIPSEKIQDLFKELDALFKIKYNEIVMRNVTVKLQNKASSIYKHPEPISSHGTSNLDSFLKENKMEGLIDTSSSKEQEKENKKDESVES